MPLIDIPTQSSTGICLRFACLVVRQDKLNSTRSNKPQGCAVLRLNKPMGKSSGGAGEQFSVRPRRYLACRQQPTPTTSRRLGRFEGSLMACLAVTFVDSYVLRKVGQKKENRSPFPTCERHLGSKVMNRTLCGARTFSGVTSASVPVTRRLTQPLLFPEIGTASRHIHLIQASLLGKKFGWRNRLMFLQHRTGPGA